MPLTSAPAVTRSDYEQMPDGPPYFQVIEGELVLSPSPSTFHQHIVLNLAFVLRAYLQEHPVGKVFVAPLDVFLSELNVHQPDLIFVSKQRRSFIARQGLEGPPDLVVEVLSASTARYDREAKRKVYARTGVRELWLVDPEACLIQVYRLPENADTPAATYGAGAVFESALFPGLKIAAAAVFERPDEPEPGPAGR